jgi:hypothetical protein
MSLRAVVRQFGSEAEASIAVAILRANGIAAETKSIGGGFNTTFAGPTAVIAMAADVDRARAVLDAPSK